MRIVHRFIRWLGHRPWFAAAGRRFGAPLDRALYRATPRGLAAQPAHDPAATVQAGSDVVPCRARLLDDTDADVYWPRLVEVWPAHESYLARSGERHTFVREPYQLPHRT